MPQSADGSNHLDISKRHSKRVKVHQNYSYSRLFPFAVMLLDKLYTWNTGFQKWKLNLHVHACYSFRVSLGGIINSKRNWCVHFFCMGFILLAEKLVTFRPKFIICVYFSYFSKHWLIKLHRSLWMLYNKYPSCFKTFMCFNFWLGEKQKFDWKNELKVFPSNSLSLWS